MPTTSKISCVSCGAKLEPNGLQGQITCNYCGQNNWIKFNNNIDFPNSGARTDAWICQYCQTANPIASNYCKQCSKLIGTNCPNCNALIPSSSKHCNYCGVDVANKIKEDQEKIKKAEEQLAEEVAWGKKQQLIESERQSKLSLLAKTADKAWNNTKWGWRLSLIIPLVPIIFWIMGIINARKSLSYPQIVGDFEYRKIAKKAMGWSIGSLAVYCILIGLVIFTVIISVFNLIPPILPFQVQNNILFSDDFSSTNSGWDRVSEDLKTTDYANGGYRMWLNETQYDIWANPSEDFSGPVSIEVDVIKVAGPEVNDFGIICNYQDVDNFHVGLVSSDGYAVIMKRQNGDSAYLSAEQMVSVNGINSGSANNHLRFDCINGDLTLYANGNQVAYVYDNSFTGGDIGLQVGTFDEGSVDFLFDNFIVSKP